MKSEITLQQAHEELEMLKVKLEKSGRIFWIFIPVCISVVLILLAKGEIFGSTSLLVMLICFILFAVLVAAKVISIALPNKWGGESIYKRIHYLEGFIAAQKNK